MKKILVCGSHFTVAQAVVEELLETRQVEIVYVGRKTTMDGDSAQSVESQILPKLGIPFYSITAGRISRKLSLSGVLSLFKIPVGLIQAVGLINKCQPDLVLSFGGYVSVPIVLAAKLRGFGLGLGSIGIQDLGYGIQELGNIRD